MGVEIKMVPVENKEDLLDHASDQVREITHHLAMQKKSITLTGLVSPEDYDIAFNRELKKAWDEIKDLDEKGYLRRVLADMLMEEMEPEEILGKVED